MVSTKDKSCDSCPCFDRLLELEQAFPDGPIPHRNAHIAWIEAKKAEAEFWKELKLEIAKKGVWGLLIITVGLIFLGITVKFGVHLPHQ